MNNGCGCELSQTITNVNVRINTTNERGKTGKRLLLQRVCVSHGASLIYPDQWHARLSIHRK